MGTPSAGAVATKERGNVKMKVDLFICHDCGAKEGELHLPHVSGDVCDMEVCPKCGGQLLSCGCNPAKLRGLPRRPYIIWPWVCARCGILWPEPFMVDTKVWEHYIEPRERGVI